MTPGIPRATPALLVALACGDQVGATGELGRLNYALATDYELPDGSLLDFTLITGAPQRFTVDYTDKGEHDVRAPATLTHTVTPDDGVTLEVEAAAQPADDAPPDAPDFTLTVTTPGDYTVESLDDGRLFDTITLAFDAPATYAFQVWLRAPDEEAFDAADPDAIPEVTVGTQAVLVPIPEAADGSRLVGDPALDLGADPDTAIVEVASVLGAYEQSVWWTDGFLQFVFMEPGRVTVTATDPANDLVTELRFEVAEQPPATSPATRYQEPPGPP